jgi:hypothetical protein
MELIPEWAYIGLTLILTFALVSCGYLHGEYRSARREWAWRLQMAGWSAVVVRFWWGLFDVHSISYAGAVGLLLLACGAVLEAMRK